MVTTAEKERELKKASYFRCERFRMTVKMAQCAAWQEEGKDDCSGCPQGRKIRGKIETPLSGETRVCNACGFEKEIEAFQRSRGGSRWGTCRECNGLKRKGFPIVKSESEKKNEDVKTKDRGPSPSALNSGPKGIEKREAETNIAEWVMIVMDAYPGLLEALESAAYDDVSTPEQWALRCVKKKLEEEGYLKGGAPCLGGGL